MKAVDTCIKYQELSSKLLDGITPKISIVCCHIVLTTVFFYGMVK